MDTLMLETFSNSMAGKYMNLETVKIVKFLKKNQNGVMLKLNKPKLNMLLPIKITISPLNTIILVKMHL
jgi:hypothetical protein